MTPARGLRLERLPIRTREDGHTESAWCLRIASDEGAGAITRVDTPAGGALYRGEGLLLGWAQERLASAYAALLPPDDSPPFETQQLG